MSQNERLREALLEIEFLREREKNTLRETKALFDILRLNTGRGTPKDILRKSLLKCSDVVGAQGAAIVTFSEKTLTVEAASDEDIERQSYPISPPFFAKARNVLDARRVPELETAAFLKTLNASSLLVAPDFTDAQSPLALLCWHTSPRFFSKRHLNFAQQTVQLISQSSRTAALALQNARLAAVIDGSSSGFAIADATQPELPLIFVNKAFEEMTGYSAHEVLGQNCRFLSAEERNSPERVRLRAAVQNREPGRFLLRNIRKDGSEFWNDLSLFPVYDDGGQVIQLVATQTDATERVRVEAERRRLQDHLQNVLDHTRDAFLMVLDDGTVAFANDGTRAMFRAAKVGWRPGSTFFENWAEYTSSLPTSVGILPGELSNPDLQALAQRPDGIQTSLPDGRQVLFRAQHAGGNAIVVSATDTTAIRTTERLLRQRAAAVENAIDGIGILDEDGRITYANTALAQLMGYPNEDMLLGRKWAQKYQIPEDADQLRAENSLKDGVEILQIQADDKRLAFHEVTRTNVEKIGEVMVVRDITRRLRNQNRLSELNSQIEDATRREAISNLAAGLAHDFNNVLSAITGSATLIETDPTVKKDIREHANRISRAGVAAARLVNRMLDLGSAGDEASVFDLRSILTEVRALAETNLSDGTVFTLDPGTEALHIRAAAQDITLLLLNLVINAHDALPDGAGTIAVALNGDAPPVDQIPLQGSPNPGQAYAQLSVKDTGSGLSKEVAENMLDAFFTTKGSRGTGAGLAMVSAIVKRLGGAIYVNSALGIGTRFDILLPRFEHEDCSPTASFIAPDLTGQTILVLDDQLEVASVTASFLENCGAEVSMLDDPALAVEVLLEDPNGWTALITDYDMPQLTGGDVIEAVHEKCPNLAIVVVTALARRLPDQRLTHASVVGVFAKPTDLGQLARALEGLDGTL